MRVMLDTNVLISMLLFPSERFQRMLTEITSKHQLVLSSFVLDEIFAVVERKFPGKKETVDEFLSSLPYELVYTPHDMKANVFQIRDSKDYPILYTAYIEDIDVLISGDKDFQDVKIDKPRIMTPMDFLERF